MSRYSGNPKLEALPDGKNWRLLDDYCYQSDKYATTVRAEKGFVFDFASIPKAFWRVLGSPATGRHRNAAVIHDWLYRNKGRVGLNALARADCDGLFYEAMKTSGLNNFKAWLIYSGVRIGGGKAWNKNTS